MPEPGQSIQAGIVAWLKKAQDKSIIGYGLHRVVLSPTTQIIDNMPDSVPEGHASFKLFMIDTARYDELASQYSC